MAVVCTISELNETVISITLKYQRHEYFRKNTSVLQIQL